VAGVRREIDVNEREINEKVLNETMQMAREEAPRRWGNIIIVLAARASVAEDQVRQLRADLAEETATRTALRTEASRVSGLLADAGVSAGLVEGVAALLWQRDVRADDARKATEERDEMRSARDVLLAENDRLRARLADIEACLEGQDAGARIGVVR